MLFRNIGNEFRIEAREKRNSGVTARLVLLTRILTAALILAE
jgi:hypothetical protein